MLEIQFIQATPEHYNAFKPMYENMTYIDVYLTPSKPRTPSITDYETFAKELGKSNFIFVDLDGVHVGYIILDAFLNGTSQIREICIVPQYQRRGYGREAIRQLIEVLKADDTIYVVKVISATIATDCFYSRCGFRHTAGDTYECQV